MTTISDLAGDLLGEIISRVPLTSLSAVRSTCKSWNALSKNLILGKKAARNHHQFLEFMVVDSRVCSLRFDLRNDDVVDSYMKQISVPNKNNQVDEISQIYHCDGLLLCITKDNSKLVVWNPYLGQTKWIRPRNQFHKYDMFAIGYDINRNHKILRFFYENFRVNLIDVYDLSSDSWRVLDVNPNWNILFQHTGLSLKGNSYFFGHKVTTVQDLRVTPEYLEVTDFEEYLLCFDFTTERFGPRLPLPFKPPFLCFETETLSWVRDEKLAVLYKHYKTPEIIEIWISTKIEPDAVSWSTFLRLDMTLIIGLPDKFSNYFNVRSFFIDEEKKVAVLFDIDNYFEAKSFFIDEEKKVAVLFDIDKLQESETRGSQMAFIFGEDGYFKSINIGVVPNLERRPGKLVCSSYVPSLVQLQV